MSRILITGGSGLLGRELCQQLHTDKNNVWVIDNHSRSTIIPSCDVFREADLTDKNTFNDLPRFDYIYHFGAINGTTNFYERSNEVLSKNFIADINTFEFAKICPNLKRIVYASTSEIVSGEPSPISELLNIKINDIHNARWSYRLAKIAGENYLANSNLPYVMIRYFNVYGHNDGPGHFISDQVEKMNRGVFEIIGGDETRSFCHVEDAIEASIYCAEHASNVLVNIGSDEEIQISKAADLIAKELGYIPNWTEVLGRIGSTKTRKPDISTLRDIMPQYNPRSFADGIKQIFKN
jgi:UDP-glucose 4-epimerase/UDP-glucuronate decarboxylase